MLNSLMGVSTWLQVRHQLRESVFALCATVMVCNCNVPFSSQVYTLVLETFSFQRVNRRTMTKCAQVGGFYSTDDVNQSIYDFINIYILLRITYIHLLVIIHLFITHKTPSTYYHFYLLCIYHLLIIYLLSMI